MCRSFPNVTNKSALVKIKIGNVDWKGRFRQFVWMLNYDSLNSVIDDVQLPNVFERFRGLDNKWNELLNLNYTLA